MSQIITKQTYATFSDPAMAEKAGGALLDHGVKGEHISIVLPEGYHSSINEIVEDEQQMMRTVETGITTTTAGDAASGTVKGAGIGLAVGTMAALAAVFIPGVGLILGGGTLALAISGVAGSTAAGAVAGGVTGFLKDQGVPEDAIQGFNKVLIDGGAMVTVTPIEEKTETATIESILTKYDGKIASYSLGTSAVVMMDDSANHISTVL